jgi:hypothetical protein
MVKINFNKSNIMKRPSQRHFSSHRIASDWCLIRGFSPLLIKEEYLPDEYGDIRCWYVVPIESMKGWSNGMANKLNNFSPYTSTVNVGIIWNYPQIVDE